MAFAYWLVNFCSINIWAFVPLPVCRCPQSDPPSSWIVSLRHELSDAPPHPDQMVQPKRLLRLLSMVRNLWRLLRLSCGAVCLDTGHPISATAPSAAMQTNGTAQPMQSQPSEVPPA